ncbi:Hypothetical protein, putative [Bodo saltans]|uniref:Uncharacterized protein n=1 Tax=Bodo saltans TaxID=75058 RepID=A0A0S4IZ94_BODSA|nr:Hypothetical protein, putative [Bodo saltans]|eukprot:CUF88066.1 Hypothetical protein, putative [Bodo saltans]
MGICVSITPADAARTEKQQQHQQQSQRNRSSSNDLTVLRRQGGGADSHDVVDRIVEHVDEEGSRPRQQQSLIEPHQKEEQPEEGEVGKRQKQQRNTTSSAAVSNSAVAAVSNPIILPLPVFVVDVTHDGFYPTAEHDDREEGSGAQSSSVKTPHPPTPSSVNPQLALSASTPQRRRRSNSNGQQQNATPKRPQVGGGDFFSTVVGITPLVSDVVAAGNHQISSNSGASATQPLPVTPPKFSASSPSANPPTASSQQQQQRRRSSSAGPNYPANTDGFTASGGSGGGSVFGAYGNNPFLTAALFSQPIPPPSTTLPSPSRPSATQQRRISDLNTTHSRSDGDGNNTSAGGGGVTMRGGSRRITSTVSDDDEETSMSTETSSSVGGGTNNHNNSMRSNHNHHHRASNCASRVSNASTASTTSRSHPVSSVSMSGISLALRSQRDDVAPSWNPLTVAVSPGTGRGGNDDDDDDDEADRHLPFYHRHSLLSAGPANGSGTTAALEPHHPHNGNQNWPIEGDDDDDEIIAEREAGGRAGGSAPFPSSAPAHPLKVSFHDFVFRLDSPSLGFKSDEVLADGVIGSSDSATGAVDPPQYLPQGQRRVPTGGTTPIIRPTLSLHAPPFLQLPPQLEQEEESSPNAKEGQYPMSMLGVGNQLLGGSFSVMRLSTATTNSGGGATTVTDASSRSMMAMSSSAATIASLLPRDGLSHREQRARKAS